MGENFVSALDERSYICKCNYTISNQYSIKLSGDFCTGSIYNILQKLYKKIDPQNAGLFFVPKEGFEPS